MKRLLAGILLSIWIILPASSSEIKFPALTGHVVDAAGILEKQTINQLAKIASSDKTNQIVIVTVNDLQQQPIEKYSIQLARHWKLGSKESNNGLLILLSKQDRQVRIEVGYGLEHILPDAVCMKIVNSLIIPALKDNLNYDKALIDSSKAIVKILAGESPDDVIEDPVNIPLIILLIVLGLILFTCDGIYLDFAITSILCDILSSGKSGGFSGGGGRFGGGGFSGRF